jgi:hypothetical protein
VVSFRVADGLVKVTLHYLQKLERYGSWDVRETVWCENQADRVETLFATAPAYQPAAASMCVF